MLIHAGFSVASYCHPESYLSNTRYNEYAYTAPTSGSAFPNLVASVRQYQPVLLIPACELAVRFLLNIIDVDANGQVDKRFADVVDLVRRSLGEPAFLRTMLSKIETKALAEELGLRVPKQVLAERQDDVTEFGDEHGYPLVLKGEYGRLDYPETVALFPNEWLRDPHSQYLTQGYHDVPWDTLNNRPARGSGHSEGPDVSGFPSPPSRG